MLYFIIVFYSIIFVHKMRAFWRLVLECFHKQKTTEISLSHDDEYPPFLGGIQFLLTNADN